MQNEVRYYIPHPDYILCQPGHSAQCASSVSEFSYNFIWVFGWKARNSAGQNFPQATLRYYSSAIHRREHKQMLNTYNTAGSLKRSTDNDSKRKAKSGL